MVETKKAESKHPIVYKDLRSKIERGTMTGALPGVKQLAKKYDVHFMTVNKAIKKLEMDNMVYRIPRKGTYVKRQYSVAVCSNAKSSEKMLIPIYHRVIMEAQRYFSSQGSPMYLEGSLLYKENIVNILQSRIDGLLLFYNEYNPMPQELLRLPCVRVMGYEGHLKEVDHVSYRNSKVGEIAAEYLLNQGCRSMAYIGPHEQRLSHERKRSFKNYLENTGAKYYDFPAEWKHDFASIEEQTFQMLEMDRLPDGIFCPYDDIVVNVCTILYRKGIDPDKDIKIIGCNNSRSGMYATTDKFASIELQPEKIGRLGAERLLQRIINPKIPPESILLDPFLVVPDDKTPNNITMIEAQP